MGPGTVLAPCQISDCVPEPGLGPAGLLMCPRCTWEEPGLRPRPYLLSTCVAAVCIMRYWDLSFQRVWSELGSSYGPEEVLRFFSPSASFQEKELAGPELFSPLSSASLCNIKAHYGG